MPKWSPGTTSTPFSVRSFSANAVEFTSVS